MTTHRIWLIKLRNRRGMTQEEVAVRAYINRAYYALIESGYRKPSIDVAVRIADLLGFHYSLFSNETNPYRLTLENSPIFLAHSDLEHRYIWLFFSQYFFDESEFIGKHILEISTNKEEALKLLGYKEKIITYGCTLRRTIDLGLSDGMHTIDLFGHPLLNSKNEIIGVSTVGVDITQRSK